MKEYSFEETYFNPPKDNIELYSENVNVFYGGEKHALYDTTLQFQKNTITALIGPSGSGKSTYLRSLNRMNDEVATVTGKIMYDGVDINKPELNVYNLREHIGMLFQQPVPFARSIYFNLAYALKDKGVAKSEIDARMEKALKDVDLFDEIKDEMNKSAMRLSGGQQQRLCLARTLMLRPDILLLDEPASALDPISTAKIEETFQELKKDYTMVIVTHNMEQAGRIADYTAFFYNGHLIEYDKTLSVFMAPHTQATNDYVSGDFG